MNFEKHVTKAFKDKPGYPIVEVLWWDAKAHALDWEEEVPNLMMPTTTVGYLVAESDKCLTVVSIINELHVGHGITIPRGCIHKVNPLDGHHANRTN